ncbi:TPR-like protein [Hypoxylon cercidicola]|nr:TPR-like protein [Hypoxylon cercidicola]
MFEPGLHVLFDSAKDSPNHAVAEIDIVAVHGLNFKNNPDHAQDTWKAGERLWLRDFLPSELAKPARVMLFSYNSSPVIGAAAINFDGHAKNLLVWLDIKRQAPQRPLIFIGHSLGGLVVKEALVEATLNMTYKPIVEATKLLIFFATPHRGGNYAGIGDAIAGIVRVGLWKPNNKLLDELKKSSNSATKRFDQSKHLYDRFHVVNFYEGKSYGKLGIIVDKESATLSLPGSLETQVATHADHSSICKFSSADTPTCQLVLKTIVREVDRALEMNPHSAKNVHWLVPRSVNSMFTGRRDVVDKIKRALVPPTTDTQERFVVTGMGGQGKSEVCLKVANELREQFWGVFWVDVSSDATAKAGFSTIAKMLGSSETEIDGVRRLLSNIDPKHHWLLVLDNADNPEVDYQQYCPSGTRGAVLLTSRNPECHAYATVGYEDLSSLNKEDCTSLLLQSIGPASTRPEVKSDAEKVIDILSSHTLAILQAGAYISRGYCSLSEYPDVFRMRSRRLLEFNLTQDQSRYHNVYATFEASAEILGKLQSESAQDSLSLLQAFSPLHYENVPLDLLEDAWKGAQRVRTKPKSDAIDRLTDWHVSQLPDFLASPGDTWDPFRMLEALNLLESLALVKKSNINGGWTVSMHPLTHSWMNLRQSPAQREESLRKGQCIIALSRYYQSKWRPYRDRIGLHLLSVLEQSSLAQERLRGYLLPVYIMIGWLLFALRYDQKLEEHIQYVFTELRIDPNDADEKFLTLFKLRSRNDHRRGNRKRSIETWRQIIHIQEATLDQTDPSRLASYHAFARAYLANGLTKDAVELLQLVVQIREITLDQTHPDRLASQHELAGAYLANGQIKEAVELLQQVVQIRETTLDQTHPDRLVSQHKLAGAYLANGQTKEAIELLQQVIQIKERILDQTHPDQLDSQHELAGAYLTIGQTKEAVELLQQVVQIRETTLDQTHPDRLASQHELARAYLYNGQTKEAVELLQQVVQIKETTLDQTHPDRLASQHELARAYLPTDKQKKPSSCFNKLSKSKKY